MVKNSRSAYFHPVEKNCRSLNTPFFHPMTKCQKNTIFDIFPNICQNVIFHKSPIFPKNTKNTIFHIFPYGGENTKIPHFPKNPKIAKIAIFAKIGDFGDILEIAIFEVFGGSAKIPHFWPFPGKPQKCPFLPLPPEC